MPRPPPPPTAFSITAPSGPSDSKNARRLVQRHRAADPREHRHATLFGQGAGLRLVAEAAERLGRRADKDEAVALAEFCELSGFAQESIAGMDGLAAGFLRERD